MDDRSPRDAFRTALTTPGTSFGFGPNVLFPSGLWEVEEE